VSSIVLFNSLFICGHIHIGLGEIFGLFAGLSYKISYSIVNKLIKVGAVSREKAVTPKEAKLDLQETQWLKYLAGGIFSNIIKTKAGRLYTSDHGL
jgi:hypothetical protein